MRWFNVDSSYPGYDGCIMLCQERHPLAGFDSAKLSSRYEVLIGESGWAFRSSSYSAGWPGHKWWEWA
jgi:hypothetical protein